MSFGRPDGWKDGCAGTPKAPTTTLEAMIDEALDIQKARAAIRASVPYPSCLAVVGIFDDSVRLIREWHTRVFRKQIGTGRVLEYRGKLITIDTALSNAVMGEVTELLAYDLTPTSSIEIDL